MGSNMIVQKLFISNNHTFSTINFYISNKKIGHFAVKKLLSVEV